MESDDISDSTEAAISMETDTTADIAVYRASCRRLACVPSSSFIRTLQNKEPVMNMRYCGLTSVDVKAMTTALVRNITVTDFILADNRFGTEGAKHISDMLTENVYLQTLDMSNNNLGSEGTRIICEMVADNNSLTSLNISGTQIKDTDAQVISDLLRDPLSARLKKLDLSHNHFEEPGGKHLALAIKYNKWLEVINLSYNHIRRKGATSICKALKLNSVLTDVDLSWNGLADPGAALISEVLKANTTLTSLNVAFNRFTIFGVTIVKDGLDENRTLKTLRIGGNMITHAASMTLLTVLETRPECSLTLLDLGDAPVTREFTDLLEELQTERADLTVIYGCVVRGFDIYAALARGRTHIPVNPIRVLRDYIVNEGLRCHDLFYRFDGNKDHIVSRTEFRKGILATHLPFSAAERSRLYRRFDRKKRGFIIFKDFADVMEDKVRNERRRRLKSQLDGTNVPKAIDSDEELVS
ncbi:uncharacterized protein LOC100368898 [Saccoglossus kowalevskii]|uniref:Uncharacterized protein C14orf166B homolog n=1 Tax=Saccoglossus kowalevskii TaxID=10224 RepID=A0ABM0GU12_SACKO|nr:PREDICTED: uncharacterized protein C14orf166B homolog [Saccoglossus kowalevskii]